jgi:hypothetical protein
VPRTREALEALPGVGRKTANVVLNVAFGEPTMAVDTHIFRVANRTGLAPGKTPLAVEMQLMKRVPAAYRRALPPLADPARPLRLPGPQATLRECVVAPYCDYCPRRLRRLRASAGASIGLKPVAATALPQVTVSARMMRASSSPVVPVTRKPASSSRLRLSGCCRARTMSACSLATISGGVWRAPPRRTRN